MPATILVRSLAPPLPAKIFMQPYRDISASLKVIHPSDLPASITKSIYLTKMLPARITIYRVYDLPARIEVNAGKKLPAKITIDVSHQLLPARIIVSKYIQAPILPASLTIIMDRIQGRINIIQKSEVIDDYKLDAKIDIVTKETSDLDAKIRIFTTTDLSAQINIFKYVVEGLSATIFIPEHFPGNIETLTAKDSDDNIIPENVYQTKQQIFFDWSESEDEQHSVSYYIAWNRESNYEVTYSDQNIGNNLSTNKYCFETGDWYFHVRAYCSAEKFSVETKHYHIKYNNITDGSVMDVFVNDFLVGPSCITDHSKPSFKWQKITDPDANPLTYELRLSTDYDFNTISLYETNIEESFGSTMIHNASKCLSESGIYHIQIRTFDGYQYSDWEYCEYFKLEALENDISARITLIEYGLDFLRAIINVIAPIDLPAQLRITRDIWDNLPAKINIVEYRDADLSAIIRIRVSVELSAQIEVFYPSDLPAKIRVIKIGSTDLQAKINMVQLGWSGFLYAKITLCDYDINELDAQIRIVSNTDLPASLHSWNLITHLPYWEDLPAQITVVKKNVTFLRAKISVRETRPDPVVIFCDIDEATWQEERFVRFYWNTPNSNFFPVDYYLCKLDKNATFINGTYQQVNMKENTYDLRTIIGSGIGYFHIAAVNTNGKISDYSHFEIRYNHAPTKPMVPLYVNNINSASTNVLVSKYNDINFNWTQIIDEDIDDIITYQIMIYDDNYTYIDTTVTNNSYTINNVNFHSNSLKWKLRTFDGNQYSDWSQEGYFTLNTPPSRPANLYVAPN